MSIIVNAFIERASLSTEDHGCLLPWLMLDYGGGGQGFGGYSIGDRECKKHRGQSNYAAEFIVRCMRAAGVEKWEDLAGRPIRVQKESHLGIIEAIGHLTRDDEWFCPREVFADWKEIK